MNTFEFNTNGRFTSEKCISGFWKSIILGPILITLMICAAVYTMDDKPVFRIFAIVFILALGLFLFIINPLIGIFQLKRIVCNIEIFDNNFRVVSIWDKYLLNNNNYKVISKEEVLSYKLLKNYNFSRSSQRAIIIRTRQAEYYLIEDFFNESDELGGLLGVDWRNG